MPIYTLNPDKQQDSYTNLINNIAIKNDDTRNPKIMEALTQQDLYLFVTENPNKEFCTLEEDGKLVPIFNADVVTRLWQQLSQRDANKDGKIDSEFLQTPLSIVSDQSLKPADPMRLAELAHQYQDAIFQIAITRGDNSTSYCYGFIIDKTQNNDGTWSYYVATDGASADDYARNETGFTLKSLSGAVKIEKAQLYASDPEAVAAIAVLKFDSPADLPICPLATKTKVQSGEAGYLIGHDQDTATVSDTNSQKFYTQFPTTKIQVDRPINENDNFGAPLFTESGLIAGLVYKKFNEPNNFWGLINARTMAESYQRMRQNDNGTVTYAEWGLVTESYGINDSRRLLLPTAYQKTDVGIWVTHVENDSAAAQAGVLPGDILLAVNGDVGPTARNPTTDEDTFQNYTLQSSPGQKYKVTLYRPGVNQVIPVIITPQTRDYGQVAAYETPNGFTVIDQTSYDLTLKGDIAPMAGVWVCTKKMEDGVLSSDEIIPGLAHRDLIVSLNGQPTPDVATFKPLFEAAKKNGEQINLVTVKTSVSWNRHQVGSITTSVIPAE
jgi:S1-C subfamily serine protease